MFEAIVIVCLLGPTQCIEARDTRGPYWQKADCIARTEEIVANVVPILADRWPPGTEFSVDRMCRLAPGA